VVWGDFEHQKAILEQIERKRGPALEPTAHESLGLIRVGNINNLSRLQGEPTYERDGEHFSRIRTVILFPSVLAMQPKIV